MRQTQIHIQDLRVDCLIGVWSHERNRTQQIRVDLTVDFDGSNAAYQDELSQTLNYADVARDVTFLLEQCQFRLLESAVWMLQRWLLLAPLGSEANRITAVDVRLTKFGALPGSTLASVQSRTTIDDIEYQREIKDWGSVDIVGETTKVGVYRLNIDPGHQIPPHYHETMREAELVLSNGLRLLEQEGTQVLDVGRTMAWSTKFVHGYENTGDHVASLLCVDSPPFIPEDERVVSL